MPAHISERQQEAMDILDQLAVDQSLPIGERLKVLLDIRVHTHALILALRREQKEG